MNIDPTGTFAFTIAMIIGLIVGAVVGAAVGGYIAGSAAYDKGARGWELFGWILLGAFGGAVVGGAIGTFIGWAAPAIGSFLGSSFVLGQLALATGETVTVSITGGQAVSALIRAILFAKDNYVKYWEKQMSPRQREQFKSEIEDLKEREGRGGADNISRALIKEIAEFILKFVKR